MEFISPFRLAPGRLRASSGKRQRTLEVDGGAQQLQMAGVAAEPDVADAAEAVTALHDPEAALDGGPDRGDRLVEPALPRLQRLVAGRRRPSLTNVPFVRRYLGEIRPCGHFSKSASVAGMLQ